MKLAVTAKRPRVDSVLDERFEQARHLVVYDSRTSEFVAGDMRVSCPADFEALITGSIGSEALHALRSRNVIVYVGAHGTVGEALEDAKAGRLSCAIEPSGRNGSWN